MTRRLFVAWLVGLGLWPARVAAQPVGIWRVITRDLRPRPVMPGPPEDFDELLPDQASAKARQALRKNPNTRVSVHLCPHAAGEAASVWWNCRDDARSLYEES